MAKVRLWRIKEWPYICFSESARILLKGEFSHENEVVEFEIPETTLAAIKADELQYFLSLAELFRIWSTAVREEKKR